MTTEENTQKRNKIMVNPLFQKWYYKTIQIQLDRIHHRRLIEARNNQSK